MQNGGFFFCLHNLLQGNKELSYDYSAPLGKDEQKVQGFLVQFVLCRSKSLTYNLTSQRISPQYLNTHTHSVKLCIWIKSTKSNSFVVSLLQLLAINKIKNKG